MYIPLFLLFPVLISTLELQEVLPQETEGWTEMADLPEDGEENTAIIKEDAEYLTAGELPRDANILPLIFFPLPETESHTVTKKALSILSRWLPFGAYMEAASVAARIQAAPRLDLVSAKTRGRGRSGAKPRIQPLRWGRRKRMH